MKKGIEKYYSEEYLRKKEEVENQKLVEKYAEVMKNESEVKECFQLIESVSDNKERKALMQKLTILVNKFTNSVDELKKSNKVSYTPKDNSPKKCSVCGEAFVMYATTVCRQCGDK